MSSPSHKILSFGPFTLDLNTASLCLGDQQLQMRPKSFDVLLYLARNPGRVVSKDELITAAWPNVFVTENSLVQCISDIREALKDDAQSILKTIPRRGYLFAAPVVESEPPPAQPRAEQNPGVAPETPSNEIAAASLSRRTIGALGFALLLAISVGAVWWSAREPARDAASSEAGSAESAQDQKRLSIAVLPFASQGASASDDYFADGLTEDIIAALGRFAELSVRSPHAVAPYKGKPERPEILGRELKVRYIAEGSVRRSPERIRITVRLTDATQGTLLWSDSYDAGPASIFAIQDEITRNITGALAVRMTNVEQARVSSKPPSSLEAYDLVLRGRDTLSRLTRSATSSARTMFEKAAELDPNYAAAYVGLGHTDLHAVALGWTADPAGALQRAENLARKAISIDQFNPAAHVLLGRAYSRLGEYDRALDALKRAMALNPSNPDSYAGLGDALLWAGDIDGAIKALEVAVQLDPRLSTSDLFNLGAAYFLAGQGADAARTFERTIARNDSTVYIHALLAAIHHAAGRRDETLRAIAEVRRRDPFFDIKTFGTLFRDPEHRSKIVTALQQAGF